MNKHQSSVQHLSLSFVALLFASLTLPLISLQADDEWVVVTSKDGKVSASFPVNLRAHPQVSVDRTAAGKVKTYFGEYYGDGILLAGSGSDIPRLAQAAGEEMNFNGTKKPFLKEAKGTEISFSEISISGATGARVLTYKGNAYRGQGGPYNGKAIFLIANKRIYIINSVITKATPEAKAAEEKLFGSIRVNN